MMLDEDNYDEINRELAELSQTEEAAITLICIASGEDANVCFNA